MEANQVTSVLSQEIYAANGDKGIQTHRKQSGTERCKPCGDEEVIRIASAIGAEVGTTLFFSCFVFLVCSTRSDVQGLHRWCVTIRVRWKGVQWIMPLQYWWFGDPGRRLRRSPRVSGSRE